MLEIERQATKQGTLKMAGGEFNAYCTTSTYL